MLGLWVEIPVGYLTKEEIKENVKQLPEREPLNFKNINSTILKLKDYPFEIKQWMILVILGIMAIVIIMTLVIIIWKVYHMRGALGQMGEVFNIIKEKPHLFGLLEAGKIAQEKLQPTAPAESTSQEILPEPSIKPEVATPLYKAIGEEFSSDRQMKKYLSKMKRIKEKKKTPDDSEGVTTDTA